MSNRNGMPTSEAGKVIEVVPNVRRILAPNPGPFTAEGTNTYIVGRGRVAIVDPGPAIPDHIAAVLASVAGESVSHILLTHYHRDHCGALPAIRSATRAMVASGRPHHPGATPTGPAQVDDAGDADQVPDLVLADGDVIDGGSWRIEAITTPGHTADHLAFAMLNSDLIFSGDHVMAWSSTVVAPPDGAMGDYMASLDKLDARHERRLLPGHGPPIDDAHGRIAVLRRHRLMREAAILERLRAGDRVVADMVAAIYRDIDPRLHGAAALSVLAHLEHLIRRGMVRADDGAVDLTGRYSLA
ncbi:MAG TPA: MBL fold metallo-hydrolase [Bauldia sp.]|nr:MBL fold metallo-hydrolase [Bauldia sp.]